MAFGREETGRLPLLQEREMWRIGKEAVINVERHARAQHLTITWTCDGRTATLVVAGAACAAGAGGPAKPGSGCGWAAGSQSWKSAKGTSTLRIATTRMAMYQRS